MLTRYGYGYNPTGDRTPSRSTGALTLSGP
jgi:hypothetical protein